MLLLNFFAAKREKISVSGIISKEIFLKSTTMKSIRDELQAELFN